MQTRWVAAALIRPDGRLKSLPAIAGHFLLFGLLFAPWFPDAARGVPVEGADDAVFIVWVLAWVAHALATDPGKLFAANINHPAPLQLAGSDHFIAFQPLFAPLWTVTGNPVLATNVTLLVTYPLASALMYLLLGRYGVRPAIAWTVALAYALGPLQVPVLPNTLQYSNVFLPLIALALSTLRRRPNACAMLACTASLVLSFSSSFHMAALGAVVAAVWVLVELASRHGGRRRFLALVVASAILSMIVLGLLSRPYLIQASKMVPARPIAPSTSALLTIYLPVMVRSPVFAVSVAGALLGIVALVAPTRRLRRLAAGGLVLWGSGTLAVLFWPQIAALDWFRLARFFRKSHRWVVVGGFGACCAGAAGLEAGFRRIPVMIGRAVIATAAVSLVWLRAPALGEAPAFEVKAVGEAATYALVGRLVRQAGGGPLLELPLGGRPDAGGIPRRTLEPDAMVGSTYHWLPLVNGYTGYEPPHRKLLRRVINDMPDREAVATLVDMTHVRWLLLRPDEDWRLPRMRTRMLEGLAPITTVVWSDARWHLLRVDSRPRHPEWFAAIANGTGREVTVLGTPLRPLAPDESIAVITSLHATMTTRARARLTLPLEVRNAGRAAWPVASSPGSSVANLPAGPSPPSRTVELVAHWRARAGAARPRPARILLPRDVPAGEAISVTANLEAPATPGIYDLEVRARQVRGSRFDGADNRPYRGRIVVADTAVTTPR